MFWQVTSILFLALGISGLFWLMVRASAARITAQYRALSERFSLEYSEPAPQLAGFIRPEPFVHGTYRGREMSISVAGKGLKNTRQIETMLKIEVAKSPLTLQMTASGMLGRFRQRDSGQKNRWMSGDRDFDSAIDVRTNDGVRLAMLLGAEGQRVFMNLLEGSKGSLYVGKGMITYTELGLIADDKARARYEAATDVLCDFAEALEG